MSPIICRWKLVKHLDCFGDNKRTKDYQNDHQVISMLLVKQQKIMLKILLVRMPLFWAVVRIMGTRLYLSSLIQFTAFSTMEFQKNKREVERFELHSKLFSSACKLPILSIKLKYPGFCCLFRFTYTYMYMQITLHSADFAGGKNDTFDFPDQMLAFLGTLFTLTIKIF